MNGRGVGKDIGEEREALVSTTRKRLFTDFRVSPKH